MHDSPHPSCNASASFHDLAHQFIWGRWRTTAYRKLLARFVDVGCQALSALLYEPQRSFAHGATSWVGQKIMTKKAGVKIGHTDDKGQQVYVATVNNMICTVLKDDGDWIRIRQQGVEGWLAKDDAVLL